jgi:hypothetical protein
MNLCTVQIVHLVGALGKLFVCPSHVPGPGRFGQWVGSQEAPPSSGLEAGPAPSYGPGTRISNHAAMLCE